MRRSAAWIAVALLLSGCVPQEVVRGGRRIGLEQAMKQDLDSARRDIQAGRDAAARDTLERFVLEFGASSRRAEARSLLADLYARNGDLAKATRTWRDLAEQDDRSPLAAEARLRGADGYRSLGRPEVARRFLEVYDIRRSPEALRPRLYRLLADLYREDGDYSAAVRTLALSREATPQPEQRDALDMEISELVRDRLSDSQLADLAPRLDDGVVQQRLNLELARRRIAGGQREAALQILDALPTSLGSSEDALRTRLRQQASSTVGGLGSIGLALPLSGEYAAFGQSALRGFALGLDVFGDRPAPYRVVVRDTAGKTDRAGTVVQDLVTAGVRCIVGPMRSSEAAVAAPLAESAHVPLITLAKRDEAGKQGSYVFRTVTAQLEQAKQLVEFASTTLHAQRFAILYPRDRYGIDFKNLFWDEVERRGGKVVAVEGYPPDAVDIQNEIKKLLGLYYMTAQEKEKVAERDRLARRRDLNAEKLALPEFTELPPFVDFDALFIPDVAANAGVVLPQLRFYDVRNVALLGPSDWNDPVLAKLAPSEAQDAIFVDSFYSGSNNPAVQDFVAKYRAAYGDAPDGYAAEGFDAARMLGALANTGTASSAESLAKALRAVPPFSAVAGLSGFDETGGPIKRLYFLTVDRGQIREYNPNAVRRPANPASR